MPHHFLTVCHASADLVASVPDSVKGRLQANGNYAWSYSFGMPLEGETSTGFTEHLVAIHIKFWLQVESLREVSGSLTAHCPSPNTTSTKELTSRCPQDGSLCPLCSPVLPVITTQTSTLRSTTFRHWRQCRSGLISGSISGSILDDISCSAGTISGPISGTIYQDLNQFLELGVKARAHAFNFDIGVCQAVTATPG